MATRELIRELTITASSSAIQKLLACMPSIALANTSHTSLKIPLGEIPKILPKASNEVRISILHALTEVTLDPTITGVDVGVYATPIEELGLITLALHNLLRNDQFTLGSLTRSTEAELLEIKYFGPHCLENVKDRLAYHGFKLAG